MLEVASETEVALGDAVWASVGAAVGVDVDVEVGGADPDGDAVSEALLELLTVPLIEGGAEALTVEVPVTLGKADWVSVGVHVDVQLTEPVGDDVSDVDSDVLTDPVSDGEVVGDRLGDALQVGLGVTGVQDPAPELLVVSGGQTTAVLLVEPAGQ